jgi:hypothetical protein
MSEVCLLLALATPVLAGARYRRTILFASIHAALT